MSWKNSLPFFAWQTVRFANSLADVQKAWSFYPRWRASMQPGHNSVADESAWITFPAIDFLNDWLRPEHRVFEFGGGGSTLFFLKRAGFVATVENDGGWFEILTKTVAEKGHSPRWEGHFIDGEPTAETRPRNPENPSDYQSNGPGLGHLSFENYARCVEKYPAAHFDLILVDGRARPSCIQHAIPRLKTGGLLVVDNNDRPYYSAAFQQIFSRDFETLLDGQTAIPFIPDFVRTTILRKK